MKYYEINEETARLAHEMMSFRDYSANRATNDYRAAVDNAAALVEQKKKEVSPYYHGKLDSLLDSYARKLADWTNAYNRNGASCPSVMICGPANFPTRKKERQNARESALWEERKKIDHILDKIRSIGTGPVDLADPNAKDILSDQLERVQKSLERAKALNAYWRKHKTFAGFEGLTEETAKKMDADFADLRKRAPYISKPYPDYELTSLRSKAKRIQARLDDLEKLQQSSPDQGMEFAGGTIVRNTTANRLQIIFDDIPTADIRQALKSHGFRWSPRNQAWQRQLTKNAEYDAQKILNIS